ncbi:peptidase inhibitor family I36 protein [Microbacterium sp. NPDC058342]|uniref:peptidase inhibitor family I36 protein n=1 Tax=Microbacterium sp. NPDC058342 TaxID=3346454 RepID=UPI00364AEFDB
MRHARAAIAAIALALIALLTPTVASAAEQETSPMQERVDEVIDEFGGEQIDWNEVSWDDGDIVLTLDPDLNLSTTGKTTKSVGVTATASKEDCASGKYCLYSRAFYDGNKLTFSACPATHTSFSKLGGAPRSIMNDRASGKVRAYNGTTVKATLNARTGTSNISGVTKVTCS